MSVRPIRPQGRNELLSFGNGRNRAACTPFVQGNDGARGFSPNTDIAIEHSQVFTILTRQNGVCSFSFLGKRRFILLGLSFSEIGDYWDHREVLPGMASAKETSRGRADRHRMLSQSPRGSTRLCPVLGCAAFRVLKPLRHMFRYGTTASCKGLSGLGPPARALRGMDTGQYPNAPETHFRNPGRGVSSLLSWA